MQTRETVKKSKKNNRSRVVLEQLDSRLLLNASSEWVDPDDLSQFVKPGYGIPDAYYADPLAYDYSANSVIEHDHDLDFLASTNDDSVVSNLAGDDFAEAMASSASKTLYLDFDGSRVYSRAGDFYLGSSYIDIPAFSLSMFGWGGREAEAIDYITNFVKEDYAAYNITVTTTQPASGEYDTMYIGGNNDWFQANSGVIGVATYDVGNRDDSNYGFAFVEELGIYQTYSGGSLRNFSEYIANLVTHEAGHNFGANHINDTSSIMNPYLPLSPRTSSFGVDSSQDTQTLMGNNLGYAHGADDFGNSSVTAQRINNEGAISGILERRDDQDCFTFTAVGSGLMTIDLDTTVYGNLDSYLTVQNSNLEIIAENDDLRSNPDSYLEFDVIAGQEYIITVSSSSQDSSGTYTLNMTAPEDPAQLTVTDNSGASDDLSIEFGTVTIGTSSSSVLTLSNTGSDTLTINSILADDGFELGTVNLAGNSADDIVIAPGESVDVTVTYNPVTVGDATGQLTISSTDENNSLVVVDLSGYAQPSQSDINIVTNEAANSTLLFGSIQQGESGEQTVTITNTGSENLDITNVSITSPFTLVDLDKGDGFIIAPGETVDLTVSVTQSYRGMVDGSLVITSDDPDESVLTIDLEAQFVGGILSVYDSVDEDSDHHIDYGTIYMGETDTQLITLVNTGDGDLVIDGISIDGDFELGTTLVVNDPSDDIVIPAGESIEIEVSYSPTGNESVDGLVTIVTDEAGQPYGYVTLDAVGKVEALEIVAVNTVTNGSVDLGDIWINDQQQYSIWTVTNHSNHSITISLSLADGSELQISRPDELTLRAGQSYTVSLMLDTGLARQVSDTLTLTANDYSQTVESVEVIASPYVLIGQGMKYTFEDHDGDTVKMSLSGDSLAKVTLGGDTEADIKTVQLLPGSRPASLNIKVSRGGETELGELFGHASLKSLNAPDVNVTGDGIDLDGSIGKVKLGSLSGDAAFSFSADRAVSIRMNEILGNSLIDIDGAIKSFKAVDFLGGTLEADEISKFQVNQFDGQLDIANDLNKMTIKEGNLNGVINVAGSVGTINIKRGGFDAALDVVHDIKKISLPKGAITGSINSGGAIGSIKAMDIANADIAALDRIDRINVLHDIVDSNVTIGYEDIEGNGSSPAVSPVDAVLGSISVKGTYGSSTISVGASEDGHLKAASGTIGKVSIANLDSDNEDTPFGLITKDAVTKILIGKSKVSTGYQQDDFFVTSLNE